MPGRYTQEQIDFIRTIAPGRYTEEIVELFNAKFGTEVTEAQIKSFKKNHSIRSNVPRNRPTDDAGLFTKVQSEFVEQHVGGLINRTFGLSITATQMNTWKKNHGFISGLDTTFKKGNVPQNKGTKGLYNVGGNRTSFKTGARPKNYMPIGSERVNSDDYVDIKIADPNKWRGKHLLVWEQHHGRPVPKDHAVIFGDGDRRNFDPDNLVLISRAQLAVMNLKGLIQNDAELTRTGVILADLYRTISQRKKGRRDL